MTTTINAQATNGLLTTADGSGIVKLQSNGVTTNSLGWAKFASTPTVSSSYNLSSMTYSGGYYTINLAAATSDSNYSPFATVDDTSNSGGGFGYPSTATGSFTTSKFYISINVFGSTSSSYTWHYGSFTTGYYVVFGN